MPSATWGTVLRAGGIAFVASECFKHLQNFYCWKPCFCHLTGCPFLCTFAKLRKVIISFVLSVHPSAKNKTIRDIHWWISRPFKLCIEVFLYVISVGCTGSRLSKVKIRGIKNILFCWNVMTLVEMVCTVGWYFIWWGGFTLWYLSVQLHGIKWNGITRMYFAITLSYTTYDVITRAGSFVFVFKTSSCLVTSRCIGKKLKLPAT